jgi:hypothetical protein
MKEGAFGKRIRRKTPLPGRRPSERRRATVELERMKNCLLYEHTRAVSDAKVHSWLKRGAEEAASIAWATPYPLLVFPLLLDEKLSEARRKAEKQQSIYLRSQPIVALAE